MQDITVASSPADCPLASRYRWISLVEIALGTFFVIGHNVFHIVPNEVPILFVFFWVSFWLRDGGWSVAGLKRPKSWGKTVLMAITAAAVLLVGSELVIQPLASHFWHSPENISGC